MWPTYSPLAGGWLSGGWRKDATAAPTSSARFCLSSPVNQRKLDSVEELAQLAEQAGITLIEMAIAFAINHPGVTSAIVGQLTMEQLESYLPAEDLTLSTEVLDRIDKLVAPGVACNPTTTATATTHSPRGTTSLSDGPPRPRRIASERRRPDHPPRRGRDQHMSRGTEATAS